jgi:cobalt-precorrin-5B (C1)-methyltransferase
LAQWALSIGGSADFAQRVQNAHTARHAFDFIRQEHPALIAHVGWQAAAAARHFSNGRIRVRTVIFDFNGAPCFDSDNTTTGNSQ